MGIWLDYQRKHQQKGPKRKPGGRTKTTWVETVEKDMNRVKVVVLDGGGKKRQADLEMMAQNKSTWLSLTRRAMSS